jgi:hypothetical protein
MDGTGDSHFKWRLMAVIKSTSTGILLQVTEIQVIYITTVTLGVPNCQHVQTKQQIVIVLRPFLANIYTEPNLCYLSDTSEWDDWRLQ